MVNSVRIIHEEKAETVNKGACVGEGVGVCVGSVAVAYIK